MRRVTHAPPLLVVAAVAAGCGGARRVGVGETSPVLKAAMRAYEAETDLAVGRAAAPAMLKLVEGLLETAPNDRELLEIVARGWAEFAFAFLEDDLESLPNDAAHADERQRLTLRATALYDRAFGFAARRLQDDDREIERALAADPATLERRLAALKKESVPGLVFAGLALASSVNLNRTDPSRVVDLPKAIALLERARQLDPAYYYGGAQMVLGLIYCAAPKSGGGDPERGRRYFEESIAQTGGQYLLPQVMSARQCSVRLGDRKGFEATLERALAAPRTADKRYHLGNEVAKRRAARYLAEIDKYF
jgi:TRAP transporter T-component